LELKITFNGACLPAVSPDFINNKGRLYGLYYLGVSLSIN